MCIIMLVYFAVFCYAMADCFIPLQLGAVAFLYHPCTPVEQVNGLREVARSCLWKHLLTPYPHLSPEQVYTHTALNRVMVLLIPFFNMHVSSLQPLALVSWGCIYRMEWVEPHLVMEWLQQNALRTDDSLDATVGAYNEGMSTFSLTTIICTYTCAVFFACLVIV